MKFIFLALTILLAGFATGSEENRNEYMNKIRQEALANINVLACLDDGGVIKGICMANVPSCIKKFVDAGKVCSDSSECLGSCKTKGEYLEPGTETSGFAVLIAILVAATNM